MKIKERVTALLHHLNQGLYEREEVLQLALLTTFAGESLFLLGPPGVAKSMIARRMGQIFSSERSFEYLMNRFSTPDELFGPIAISKLKNEDKYERVTDHYLPWADVGFLDEIWKAGPSIQNALLTIINEKCYRNGQQEVKVPLKLLIAASNELPAQGQGLEALWDRFIVRHLVLNMVEPKHFKRFLSQTDNTTHDFKLPQDLKITEDEYHLWRQAIQKIKVSNEAINVIQMLRQYIEQHNAKQEDVSHQLYVSDRRWRKVIGLLQTSAYLNERTAIDLMDCFLISDTLWNDPSQIPLVEGFVEDAIGKHGYKINVDLPYFVQKIDALQKDITEHTREEEVTIKDYTPTPIQKGQQSYYQLKKPMQHDGIRYHYLLTQEIDNIMVGDYGIAKLYASLSSTPLSVKITKEQPHKLIINHFNKSKQGGMFKRMVSMLIGEECELIHECNTRKEFQKRQPHQAVLDAWNNNFKDLGQALEKARQQLDFYKNEELGGLKENLFVAAKKAKIVERNLKFTQDAVLELTQRLTKLEKHTYGIS